MATPQIGIERRAAQRFDFHRSVTIRRGSEQGLAFTQDLSVRGMFLYTDMVLRVGENLEVVLDMPSEITLSDDARVRCQVRVLRVTPAAASQKSSVALLVKNYEYLQEEPVAAHRHTHDQALETDAAVLAGEQHAWTGSFR
jgi:ketopantoate hydroxymethyltransferase